MLHKGSNYNEALDYTALHDLNLFDLWYTAGSEWTLIMREECLTVTNQLHKKGKPISTRRITLLGAMAALALLGAATLTQTPVASQIQQESLKAVSAE